MAPQHPRVAALRPESNQPEAIESRAFFPDSDHLPCRPRISNRGKKPLVVSSSVERGLVRFLNYTTVPFDKLAQAVRQARGPSKQWLREHMEKITGTKRLGDLRLPLSEHTEKRKEEQLMALKASANGPENSRVSSFATQSFPSDDSENKSSACSVDSASPNKIWADDIARAGSRPPSSNGPESIISNSTKRRRTEDSEDLPDDEANKYAKKKHLANILSMTSIARHLEDLVDVEPGYFSYIGKRCSATAETIASRVSLNFTSPRCSRSSTGLWSASAGGSSGTRLERDVKRERTAQSEYNEFYYSLTTESSPTTNVQGVVGQGSSGELDVVEARTAVSAVLYAMAQRMSDETAERYLQSGLPNDETALKSYITVPDDHGTTALHLTVAFGWPRVCGLLLRAGADSGAVTLEKTSISRFAKPAQTLALDDIALYDRIARCREWVEQGRCPPVPPEAHSRSRGQQSRKHSRNQKKPVSSVNPVGIGHARTESTFRNMTQDSYSTSVFELGGMVTTGYARQATEHSLEDPQYAQRFTDSPSSESRRRDFQNRSDSFDFAPRNFRSQNAGFFGSENLLQSSHSERSHLPKVSLASSMDQYDSLGMSSLRNSSDIDSTPVTGPNIQQHGRSGMSNVFNAGFPASVAPTFTPDITAPDEWLFDQPVQPPQISPDRTNVQSMPEVAADGFRAQPYAAGFQQHGEHAYYFTQEPLQVQPHVAFEQQWSQIPTSTLSSAPVTPSVPVQTMTPDLITGAAPIWQNCEHLHPLNYQRSYCYICPPLSYEWNGA